ncbi:MAG: hypothetical protein KatS3mg031_0647 [Chitinophagales bacterium]|nr:MAG: hypothetical protein KatS3mg031_0647 [Chitinophagales bacterium]
MCYDVGPEEKLNSKFAAHLNPKTAMRPLIQHVEVRRSKIHGLGVFAKKDIRKGQIIEQCPYLITFLENHKLINDYLFYRSPKTGMIILGYGCIYNHSPDYNAEYFEDTEKKLIEFVARRNIKKGEEIFIHYGDAYFKDRNMRVATPSFR